MPSGLTSKIYYGEDLSLRGFALRCATQFSAGYYASKQGSEELPLDKAPELEVKQYHRNKMLEAIKELEKWESLKDNLEEAQRLYDEEYAQHMEKNAEVEAERNEIKKRYDTMLEKVKAWNVPTTQLYLKTFMLEHLEKTMQWDCTIYTPYNTERVPIEEWLESKIKWAKRDVEYHTKEYDNHEKDIETYNKTLKELYDALDAVEPLT